MKHLLATILAIFKIDAFSVKEGKQVLTQEQKAKLTKDFGEAFANKFEIELANDFKPADGGSGADPEATEELDKMKLELTAKEKELATAKSGSVADLATINSLTTQVENLTDSVATLTAAAEGDPGTLVVPIPVIIGAVDHSVALFAQVDNQTMVLKGRPYNQRAAQAMGLDIQASNSIDYSELESDLGAYYRTRKTDAIQSFTRKLPSNEALFPLESGYQDQTVLANAFLGEFSQAFQDTFTAKGSYEITPEILTMYDLKFDHKFSELKKLEKQWIGYLNREGADAMKWSFIEFILAETAKKLHNEREQRRIKGLYVAPSTGVAGSFLNGATGLLPYIKSKINAFQIKPFSMGEWTTANIVEYVFEMAMQIPQDLRDTGELIAYGSTDAAIYYEKNFNTNYGTDTDYKGKEDKVKFIKSIKFVPVHNMGASKRIIISIDGNIKFFEDQPNEMYKFNFEQEDRSLKVWSDWREGVAAVLVGKKFASAALQDFDHQMIWCNDVDEPATYFIDVVADDATPSVSVHTSIKTGVNTGATAITDIDDMAVGQTVIVKCGGDDVNNSSIAKAGNFAAMSAAWTPDAGDTITLYKRGAGDIIDMGRTTASTDAIALAADDTSPSVAAGTSFITIANTGATAITTLDDAVAGETYTIYGGSDADSSTIADAGEFDLTAGMTLDLGSYIVLYARATDDFLELARG